jgi:aminodeoxyfutalosine deaminase
VTFPKIELHVHLEGTVRAATLLDIAKRNDVALPADTVEALGELYEFTDFTHFTQVWAMTTCALRTARDFRQTVVDYAAEAATHGAVYIEGIFGASDHVARGVGWDEVFSGFCDGAAEAFELHGVRVRLTPDVNRRFPAEVAELTARYAVAYAERGVVGLGIGGREAEFPPEPFARAFQIARGGGLGSVPHAGEAAGAASIRGALDALGADRLRHGIRAVEDPGLVRELAGRGIVLDVCPISNVRTRVVRSLAEHPLPGLVSAGVACSVSTDDPAMFDTDLSADYAAAGSLGVSARQCFDAGLRGMLCDEATREELRRMGQQVDWAAAPELAKESAGACPQACGCRRPGDGSPG